jgi:hypothetical protein
MARKAEKVLNPAIKKIASSIARTQEVSPDFRGYQIYGGTLKDPHGRTVQYQISAMYAKKDMIEDTEEPIKLVRKWAIGLKLRALAKHIVDTIFENK